MTKIKTPKEPNPLFTESMKIYCDWIKKITGVPAKIDGAQGRALKYIIAYLKTIDDNHDKIIESWYLLLENYDKWDNFHKKQLKLTEINSNIVNIINFVKNGKKSVTTPKSIEEQGNDIINSPEWRDS